jgi:hypothetical protein
MIIMKKAISRRTVLRGLGVSLALPLLDGMVPALTALSTTAANPIRRLGVVYVPNGMMMPSWLPETVGQGFEFKRILQPLEPFRDRLLLLSGLDGTPTRGGGAHTPCATRFLTGVATKPTDGSDLSAAVSMDQLAARVLGHQTQLGSLELALDGRDFSGSCELGTSCAYLNTMVWRDEHTPLPMESNPRNVFERLFGDSGTTAPAVRNARLKKDSSLLDSVVGRVAELQRDLGPSDRTKIDQYLEAVRDVERRIQKTEEQSSQDLPSLDQPAGVPATVREHARLMFDLQTVAYQADLTRIVTFMIGREITGRTYPDIGVPDSHHAISHHQGDPEKIEKVTKINHFHATLFAEFLEHLRTTPDGDGSLLDHVTILYGAGMADSNQHAPKNLPILLVGGGIGKGGRHIKYADGTPMANLHLTLLDNFGIPVERLGNSTERLPLAEPLGL